jgi:two-component sensor histidine kinase
MATIHEILYESDDFSSLDFAAYAERIARTAARAADSECSLDLRLESVRIGLERAVPCGLILSEALSNAIRHGRSEDGKARISLRLAEEESRVVIEVADSGPGFPPDFGEGAGRAIGRILMLGLAEQARGEISFENDGGARVRLVLGRA